MANTNVAFGLRPIGVVGQGYNTTGATEYRIAAGNTNAIYQGSPVIPLSTGFIDIVGAAAGGTVGLVGVFAGASTTTGISSAKLAVGTINTTANLNLRIMGIQDDPENSDFTAAGIPLIVRLNNSFNSPNGAIAGGTVSTTGV
jgi:hypothetical protein